MLKSEAELKKESAPAMAGVSGKPLIEEVAELRDQIKLLVEALEWAADYLEGDDGDKYVAGKLRTALAKGKP